MEILWLIFFVVVKSTEQLLFITFKIPARLSSFSGMEPTLMLSITSVFIRALQCWSELLVLNSLFQVGRIPLHMVMRVLAFHTSEMEKVQCIRVLLSAGANVNAEKVFNSTHIWM